MYERLRNTLNQIDSANYQSLWESFCMDRPEKPRAIYFNEEACMRQSVSRAYTQSSRYCLKDFGRDSWWNKSTELEDFRRACKQIVIWNHLGNWRNYSQGWVGNARELGTLEKAELKRMKEAGVVDDTFTVEPLRMRSWRATHIKD